MKRRYFLLIIFLLTAGSSCKKFLETNPTDVLPTETYYTTEEQLNRGLFSDLDRLLRLYPEQWFGWHSLYPIQEAEPEQPWNFGGDGHESSEAALPAREEVKSSDRTD